MTLRRQEASTHQTRNHQTQHDTHTNRTTAAPYVPALSDARLNLGARRFRDACLAGEIYECLAEQARPIRDEIK